MNLRRGFLRLGIGLVLLWLVFWNCAYVISPYNTSLKPEPAFVILVNGMACSRALSYGLRRSRRLDRGGVPVKLGHYLAQAQLAANDGGAIDQRDAICNSDGGRYPRP